MSIHTDLYKDIYMPFDGHIYVIKMADLMKGGDRYSPRLSLCGEHRTSIDDMGYGMGHNVSKAELCETCELAKKTISAVESAHE